MKTQHLSRRTFITTTALAFSSGWLGLSGSALAASKSGKMSAGCRDSHLHTAGAPDCWSAMKALGADALEVAVDLNLNCVNLRHPTRKYCLATPEGVQILQEDLAASGCAITSFIMSNCFDERLDQELDSARKLAKAADQLGVKAVRIDVAPAKLPQDKFLSFAIDACKKMCEAAEGTSVRWGVENHGPWGNNPDMLEKLFDGVNSPKLGLTMDPGNFYWWGHPLKNLYAIYEKFAPRTIHLHCKSIRYPEAQRNVQRPIGWEYEKYSCSIIEGDLDYRRIVKILRQAHYQGDLCVEDESLGKLPQNQQGESVKKQIAMLKKLI